VYYITRDVDGVWRGADTTKLQLPMSKAAADKHALVYDTGHEFASHKLIAVGADDTPYLRFSVGVDDWKNKKVVVPGKTKFAAPTGGKWDVFDKLPQTWPATVRRSIMAPSPAAYGKAFPNPWFIHFKSGPEEDRSATYIWLGHCENGYAVRSGGPAPSPKD